MTDSSSPERIQNPVAGEPVPEENAVEGSVAAALQNAATGHDGGGDLAVEGSPETDGDGPLTLSELARRSGVSVPTLQRYKRLHGDRIPTVKLGRREGFSPAAVAVVQRIKTDNLERSSLPRPAGRLLSLTAQRRAAEQARQVARPEPVGSPDPEGEAAVAEPPREQASDRPEVASVAGGYVPEELPGGLAAKERSRDNHREPGGDHDLEPRIAALEAGLSSLEREIRTALQELRYPWVATFKGPW